MKRTISIFMLLAMLLTLLPSLSLPLAADAVGEAITPDTSWYTADTSADEFYIADAADLLGLGTLIADTANNNLFRNKIIHTNYQTKH